MSVLRSLVAAVLLLGCAVALADKQYGPGVTDTEIKIGQTFPYSGPASGYSTIARTQLAYFEKINAEGGVNGRRVKLISLDDGYQPPKTVEQTRRLVEEDEVLLLFSSLGTPTVGAIQKYVNVRKIPTLFLASGATRWGDKSSPWTMGFIPTYHSEMRVFASYIQKNFPNAKVGVLFLNNDAGKDYLEGVQQGFGDLYKKFVVSEVAVEVTEPTVDSQIIAMKASGADVLLDTVPTKAAAQTIRKVFDMGWRPPHLLSNISASVATVLQPAGLEKSIGLLSTAFQKDPSDPRWKEDPATLEYLRFMRKYFPEGDPSDALNVGGYNTAQTMIQVLKQCGDDLTRENVMRQATNLKNLELPMLLPGIKINTSPTDRYPLKQLQMMRFDGVRWIGFGEIIGHE